MVELKKLEIRYGDFVAMIDLDLFIKKGEFFTFLGPSGCGKTTILRSITGFVDVHDGQILIDDADVTKNSVESRGVGIVFQSYALFPTMNVYENIAFGLRVQKNSEEVIDQKVREMAKKIDLSDEQLQKKAHELSGGQQQRVAIARALILKPKILCLDEPLSNLDAKLRQQLRVELKRLQREFNITTIYVTHDQEEALTMSDRIAVFNNGKLEQVGTPFEIFEKSETEFVANFIGDINKIPYSIGKKYITAEGTKENRDFYIRLNDVSTQKTEGSDLIAIDATVTNVEFYGMFLKHTYSYENGLSIQSVSINQGDNTSEIGGKATLYIKNERIKQYHE